MEDEIDLRAYVTVLLRNWLWIVGPAVVLAVVAFAVSSALPKTYEASAVVLVTQPRYQLQFDPRFDTESIKPVAKAFPTLATSDTVLQAVVDTYVPPAEAGIGSWNVGTLAGMARASSEGDPSLVVLTVRSGSPRAAAEIANAWARALADRGNDIYGSGEADVLFFEQQLTDAEAVLDQAESALIDFEARDQSEMLLVDLESLSLAREDYLASQRATAYLIQDLRSLRSQWANAPAGQAMQLADGLTVLLLQVRAFNPRLVDESTSQVPITLQVNDQDAFLAQSREEQLASLDSLAAALEGLSSEIEGRLASLEPQALELQQRIQTLQVEEDRLTR
ncbi:MAG TPA: Wzz/FepE/Etk N-terminal domain-containing protein, partial [Anaerolineae bacterium]|nr:Wzz/FepE/Etk N-terminal domain-containing protein [Anaerolineae bacterium]